MATMFGATADPLARNKSPLAPARVLTPSRPIMQRPAPIANQGIMPKPMPQAGPGSIMAANRPIGSMPMGPMGTTQVDPRILAARQAQMGQALGMGGPPMNAGGFVQPTDEDRIRQNLMRRTMFSQANPSPIMY